MLRSRGRGNTVMRYLRITVRTTVNIDEEALAAARRLYDTSSPSVAVNRALREAVDRAALERFDALSDVELDLDVDTLATWREGRG